MTSEKFPHGFGAKIQPSNSNDQRLYAHNPEHIPFVVCKIHELSWFANRSRIAFLSPEQDLFASSYEDDSHLLGRTVTKEVDELERVEGMVDGAFTGDRFTYGSMNRRELAKEIDESVQRQLTANELIQDRGIDIPHYPAIMGWEPWHYERCRILLEEIRSSVGFDATQYNSKNRLAEHVRTLDEVLQPDRIFVNGCVAPEWLRLLPKTVVACSGSYNIREESRDAMDVPRRSKLPEIVERRVKALNSWQSDLTNFL